MPYPAPSFSEEFRRPRELSGPVKLVQPFYPGAAVRRGAGEVRVFFGLPYDCALLNRDKEILLAFQRDREEAGQPFELW